MFDFLDIFHFAESQKILSNIRYFISFLFFIILNSNFLYSQSITFISPEKHEILICDSLYQIEWTSNDSSNVVLEYSSDDGENWTIIAADIPSPGSYIWNVPELPTKQGLLKLRSDTAFDSTDFVISPVILSLQNKNNPKVSDSSNLSYNSITGSLVLINPSPINNGSIVLDAGTYPTITWTSSGILNVDLDYSINGGLNWNAIDVNIDASIGSYSSWQVPAKPTTELLIRIKESGGVTSSQNSKFAYIKSPQFNPDSLVKILPAGNSITFDSFRAEFRYPQNKISYRFKLWDLLRSNNYDIDFIGHKFGGYSKFPDAENNGIPGIKDNQLYNFLLTGLEPLSGMQVTPGNYLNYFNPDIVLLHIGTNGVETDQSSTDVKNILNLIDNFETTEGKDIWVVLALIIDDAENVPPDTGGNNPYITSYNNNLRNLARTRINNGDKILIADMQNDAGLYYRNDQNPPFINGDIYDGIHPNDGGKEKMAKLWFNVLRTILPNSTTSSPVIVSIPKTKAYVGLPYRYNIDATGVGAPNYIFADTVPTGMTINQITGIIDWIPGINDLGDHSITVKAHNAPGGDSPIQQFTINVLPAPELPERIVSYWSLDETGSSTYYEDFPGINDAFPVSPPTSVSGIVNNALSFNGTSNKLNVSDDSSFYFYPNEDFTIEMWIKTTQSSSHRKAFLGKTEGYSDFFLGINSSNQTEFDITDSIGNKIIALGPPVNDGIWHHVSGSIDRENKRVNIYVDGNRTSTFWAFNSSGFFSHDPLTIGYYRYNNYYNGLLDEIAIYNRRVPGFELNRHFISGLARKGYSDNYILASIRVLLQGPYNSLSGLMDTTIKANNLVPKSLQPYSAAPWNYDGFERVDSYPDSVVDWVYVELRDPDTPATVVSSRAAFIKKNGNLVEIDPDNDTGLSPAKGSTWLNYIIFPEVSPGNYYIVIKHRNHLAIMSKNPVALSKSSALYDFTTGQDKAYTTGPLPLADLGGGKYGMFAGDANADGTINATDYNFYWLRETGTPFEYYLKTADFNLDATINTTDYNSFWLINNGKTTQVKN